MKRAHAPYQLTSSDPDQAVRVLEAHLGGTLAAWQQYIVVAMLTPRRFWDIQPGQGRADG